MRILILGSKGMLGTDLMAQLQADHTVTGLDLTKLDITDLEQTIMSVEDHLPNIVINCAAYTNVDGCESDIESAYRVNALGPRNLAVACERIGVALMHISSDYVFSGTATRPYREDDATNPQSVYGLSKLAGENYIKTLCSRYYIIRTSWLFGANGSNFVKTMLRLAMNGEVLRVVDDQTGSPTYTKDLAEAVARLIKRSAYGTYHLTNSGICTWHGFAKSILEMAGLKNELIPVTSEDIKRPAPRPAYSVLDNFNWRIMGYEPLRHYQEGLKDYLKDF